MELPGKSVTMMNLMKFLELFELFGVRPYWHGAQLCALLESGGMVIYEKSEDYSKDN